MSQQLEGTELHLASPPLCCCCPCLPTIKLSVSVRDKVRMIFTFHLTNVISSFRKNIRRLEMMVYQVAIVRPILYFIDGVVWVDSLGVVGQKVKHN